MGKILDTITVLFKGDTSDLAAKKKEAEQLSQEAADNIKATKTATDSVNASLDATTDKLTTTELLTKAIGAGIASWGNDVTQSINSLTLFLAAEKARKETEKTNKNIGATKKGAYELEDALKKVGKQFANIALGAVAISSIGSAFKNVVSGTLDLAQASRNLDIPIAELNARGQALKEVGGSIDDITASFVGLQKTVPVSGDALLKLYNNLITLADKATDKNKAAIRGILLQFGLSEKDINFHFIPGAEQKIADIKRQDQAIDDTKEKVLALHTAWNDLGNSIRDIALDIENSFAAPITGVLKVITSFLSTTHEKGLYEGLKAASRRSDEDFEKRFGRKPEVGGLQGLLNKGKQEPVEPTLGKFFQPGQHDFRLGHSNVPANKSTSVDIGTINVNAPNAVDSQGISQGITSALQSEIKNLQSFHDNSILA